MTSKQATSDWEAKAAQVVIDGRPFIHGKRVDALTDARFDVVNTNTGQVLASLADCGQADVDRAVLSARSAFQSGIWSDLSPSERGRALRRYADIVERESENLALLDTLQMGMPISVSTGAAPGAIGILREAAELADKAHDGLVPSRPSALAMQVHRPYGVVGAITPWNYPLHVALGRIAPALAAGNSVILKPSEIAPLAMLRLVELGSEAGLPDGVLNALPGQGASTGKALALHMDVDCLAFTGSTATGLMLMQYAGQSNMKALHLECGGKSPQLVFDDGGNLDVLAATLVGGFTHNSGQICSAGSRILIADKLYDRLLAALAARVEAMATGRSLDPATELGPLSSTLQFNRVNRILANAGDGTRLVAKGRTAGGTANEIAPQLFEASDPKAHLVQQEIFGPVGSVLRFHDAEEAVKLANDTRYGLTATVWCGDFELSHRVARRLRSGFVEINAVATPQPADTGPFAFEPFGMSGLGAYGGIAGIQAFTKMQGAIFNLR